MKRGLKGLRFWGRFWFESMGMVLGISLFLPLLNQGLGSGAGGWKGWLAEIARQYPYYLMIAGLFTLLMLGISYFQVYFPILVTMNQVRKRAVAGMWVSILTIVLGITGGCGLIWSIFAPENIRIIAPLIGAFLITAAISVMAGAITLRWGKIGTFLFVGLAMLIGMGLGIIFAAGDELGLGQWSVSEIGERFGFLFFAGMIGYLLAGIFALCVTRKAEVR